MYPLSDVDARLADDDYLRVFPYYNSEKALLDLIHLAFIIAYYILLFRKLYIIVKMG